MLILVLVAILGAIGVEVLKRESEPTKQQALSAKQRDYQDRKASASSMVTTSKGTFAVPGTAFMDGRDFRASPPMTLMSINIWDSVPRTKPVCEIRHGTPVKVHEVKYYGPENRYYFRVSAGSCGGWVSEPFLSTDGHDPIGDRFKDY